MLKGGASDTDTKHGDLLDNSLSKVNTWLTPKWTTNSPTGSRAITGLGEGLMGCEVRVSEFT